MVGGKVMTYVRRYLAVLDNGVAYSEVEYYSEHRNNSKANMEDLKAFYRRTYGRLYDNIIWENTQTILLDE